MLRNIFVGAIAVLVGSASVAMAEAKDDVTAAAKKLADQSYAWTTTT